MIRVVCVWSVSWMRLLAVATVAAVVLVATLLATVAALVAAAPVGAAATVAAALLGLVATTATAWRMVSQGRDVCVDRGKTYRSRPAGRRNGRRLRSGHRRRSHHDRRRIRHGSGSHRRRCRARKPCPREWYGRRI